MNPGTPTSLFSRPRTFLLALDLSVQEAPQRFAIVALGLLGHAGIRCLIEAVIRPRVHVKVTGTPARFKRSA